MKTLKIGITGGIGAGKSYISGLFNSQYGVPIFYSDLEVIKIAKGDKDYKNKVLETFGEEVFTDGEIDRMKISNKVFSSPENVKIINKILKPFVLKRLEDFVKINSNHAYVLVESAIFHEAGTQNIVDILIGVDAPEDIRLIRACERDNHTFTEEQIKRKISNQLPQDKKMAMCDYVINNDGVTDILPIVEKYNELFIKLAEINEK